MQHDITAPQKGDFLVDDSLLFEIGGRNKKPSFETPQKMYLACDDIETGHKEKIPLWLFGFLY